VRIGILKTQIQREIEKICYKLSWIISWNEVGDPVVTRMLQHVVHLPVNNPHCSGTNEK